jgi:hypothetical protein
MQLDSTLRGGLGVVGFLTGGAFGSYHAFNGIMERAQRLLPGRGIAQLWLGVPLTLICGAAAAGIGYGAMPLMTVATLRAYHVSARAMEGFGRDIGVDDPSVERETGK